MEGLTNCRDARSAQPPGGQFGTQEFRSPQDKNLQFAFPPRVVRGFRADDDGMRKCASRREKFSFLDVTSEPPIKHQGRTSPAAQPAVVAHERPEINL